MVDTTLSMSIDAKGVKSGSDTAVRSLDDIKKSAKGATESVDTSEKSIKSVGNTASAAAKALTVLAAAFSINTVVQYASELESLKTKLATVSGSAALGAEAFSYLTTLAQKQSVEIGVLGDAYARLLPSVKAGVISMMELRKILPLVNDNIKAFGLSTGQSQALLLGLSQTLGSGTVTLEDLRQVTDQLPGSINKIAAAFGKSLGQFKDMISTGKVLSKDIVPALTMALQENEGAAEKFSGTYAAASVRFGNSLKFAADEILNTSNSLGAAAGVMDFVAARIRDAATAAAGVIASFSIAKDLIARTSLELQKPFISKDAYEDALNSLDVKLLDHAKILDDINNGNTQATKTYQELGGVTVTAAKATKELTKEQEKALKLQEKLNEKRREFIKASEIDLDQQTRLNAANQNSARMYQVVSDGIERENKLRDLGLTLKTMEGQKIDDLLYKSQQEKHGIEAATDAREKDNKSKEDAIKLQEDLNEKRAQPFIDASKNIQSGVASNIEDAIKTGLQDGFTGNSIKNTFKSFRDLLTNTIITSVANGMAASFTSSLINPMLGNFATSLNGQGVGAAANKGLGIGGSGLSGISGLGSLSGLFGAGGLAASGGFGAINMFGASTLGTGLPALAGSGGIVGSGVLGGATLTGLLGGAGIGAGVGSLTAGLYGGNAIGGAVGGAAGGIAGGLLGQALIPIPGVGFVIGSALGGIAGGGLGGLFGAGKAVSAAEFAGNVTSTGLSGVDARAKKGDVSQAQGLADNLGGFLSQIVASGIDIATTDVRGAINSKSGNRFEVLGKSIGFDPADTESVSNAISKVAIELAKAGTNSGSLAIALQNIQTDGRKAEEVLADLNFAANFDKLGDAPKKLTAFEQAVDELKKQFDAAEETTKRLGLSEEKLAGFRKQQFDLLTTQFNDDISAQILEITDPTTAAINELNKAFVDVRINAAAVGGDMVKVEELYNLKLIEINKSANDNILQAKQQAAKDYLATEISLQTDIAKNLESTKSKFEGFASSLRSFRLGLLTNASLSPLSNEERFRAAQAQFNSTSTLAGLGNEEAINNLQDTSQTYLEAAKDYYGTTAPVFDAVQAALENTESVAMRQASIASQQLTAANTQISILSAIRDGVNKSQATGAASNPTKYGTDPKISQINYLLDAATNFKFAGNFGGGAFDRFAASTAISDAEREAARNVHRSFGLIPAYANGGDHPGGLRIVGERGIEAEVTGSSKIIPNKTLMEALSGGGNAEVVATMRASDKSNREEIRALRRQLADSEKRNQDMIKELFDRQDRVSGQLISILNKPNVRAS